VATIAFHDPRLSSTAGGGESVTLQLISALLDEGHDVTAVTRSGPYSALFEGSVVRMPQLRCVAIEVAAAGIDSLPRDAVLPRRLWATDRLAPDSLLFNLATRRFYEHRRFDLIVVSFVLDLALLASADRVLFNVFGLPPSSDIARLERPLLDRCAGFTFASAFVKREFQRLFNSADEGKPGLVVHASIHPAFFQRFAGGADHAYDVAFAGRLLKRKGVDILLDAVWWLRRHRGRVLRLAVAGDGPERVSLESHAVELGIASQVQWMGSLSPDEVALLLANSGVFAYPSVEPESFGCSNLEAMACGVPVVTTNLGGTTEYLRPGQNALACEPRSMESLALALEAVLADSALRGRLAAEGRLTARQFHPSRISPLWVTAFEGVLPAAR
jgi:glycosyltransferase involved in cell wall biosynthesis